MDEKLLVLINQKWTSPALNQLMAMMSSFDFWTVPIAVAVLLLLGFGGFKMRAMLIVIGIVIAVSETLVSNPLKKLVHRPRPHQVIPGVNIVSLARAKPRVLAVLRPARVRHEVVDPVKRVVEGRSFPS